MTNRKPRCEWCGNTFDRPHEAGPEPKYCTPGHRQRAYEARLRTPDERAVALVSEWWMMTPVADYADDSKAMFEDVKALFDHLQAHGYTVARIPGWGREQVRSEDG